jgi:transposase
LDTARYGHHVSFLRSDLQPAAKAFTFAESPAGYAQLRQALERLQQNHANVHFCIRIDAAGLYAVNLEQFLRALPWEKTISVGQPKQNRDYCKVHFPKRKADAVESLACARFAIVEHPAPTPETPKEFARLRELAGAVDSQAKQTTRLVNQLHNHLARVFPELALDVSALSATWALRLLEKYPSPAKIAGAHLSSLLSIPHMMEDKAQTIQATARQTVASLEGAVVEGLIRQSVRSILQSQKTSGELKRLMAEAYDDLPSGSHQRIETIPGIGKQTAAALVAKMVSIDHFDTPDSVVGYFGIFPEENTSGVDKRGRPVPPGTMFMSRKGNDLVRGCLWNAAKSAILHNPVIRDLYARQRAQGKRGDVALGHCMRKLLHLVFAVWKTDQPFAPRLAGTEVGPSTAPQGGETAVAPSTAPQAAAAAVAPSTAPQAAAAAVARTAVDPSAAPQKAETAGGRKGQSPERQAVTPAPFNVPPISPASNAAKPAPAAPAPSHRVDFAQVRKHISIEQVLRQLHAWDCLKGQGAQRRGPCPIHEPSSTEGRSFSVNTKRNIFQCFDASCRAKGNVLDLWAQSQHTTIAQAAQDMTERFRVIAE